MLSGVQFDVACMEEKLYFCTLFFIMVEYRKCVLNNGLTVLTHEAWDTPMASVNLLYNVGARDEDERRTGFAHLFEHLMFSGTHAVPDFDGALTALGGESNAMTNNDYTDYYLTVPVEGLGEALRMEADRMADLVVDERALSVQQRVVTEEYNQRYMNQPYGDMWLLLRPLCYKSHPYRWPAIGADIRHVSEASLEDVRAFHERFYRSDNAVLAVGAPMSHEAMLKLVEEAWQSGVKEEVAGDVEPAMAARCKAVEPEQCGMRSLHVEREVPASALMLAYPMCDHFDERFRVCDVISDLLSNGKSSRMYNHLVKGQRMMVEADAYITGDASQGLMVLSGKLREGVGLEEGMEALRHEARVLAEEMVDEYELRKVVNKYESTAAFSQYKVSDRVLALNYYTWLGQTSLVNEDVAAYARVKAEDVWRVAGELFVEDKENRLYYEALR